MNIRVTRFYLKTALESMRDHVSDCFCLSPSLRPSSPSPPWPRTCPSVTLCPCQRTRLSTATTRNGWCRRTFRWQLPSDRASRPSMCTQATPPTDKVGITVLFTIVYTPSSPACSCEVEPHHATLTICSAWLYWWSMMALPCISCAFCSHHSDVSAPVCFHNKQRRM